MRSAKSARAASTRRSASRRRSGCPQGPPIQVDLELDGYKIGFASVESARQDHGLDPAASSQRATITLRTRDTAKAYRIFTTAGIPGLAGPSVWLDRLMIAWVQDPDGHPVQLAQRLDKPASSALA